MGREVQIMENSDPLNLLADKPLDYRIIDGVLCISIGINTLAYAMKERDPFYVYDENKGDWRSAWVILDNAEFAKDFVAELSREEEDGSTPLTDMLDKVADNVLENGCIGIYEGEPKWPEELDEDEP